MTARSRSGCWTCRRRRRKCDEGRPECKNCLDRGVRCEGYRIILSDFNENSCRKGELVSRFLPSTTPIELGHPIQISAIEGVRESIYGKSLSVSSPAAVSPKPSVHSGTGTSPAGAITNVISWSATGLEACIMNDTSAIVSITRPDFSGYLSSCLLPSEILNHGLPHASESSPTAENLPTGAIVITEGQVCRDFCRDESRDTCYTQDELQLDDIWASFTDPFIVDSGTQTQSILGISQSTHKARLQDGIDEMITLARAPALEAQHTAALHSEHIFSQLSIPVLIEKPFDRFLFRHFVEQLSQYLSPVEHERNPFRQIYACLAPNSPLILKTILAISSLHLVHLGRLPIGFDHKYRDSASEMLQHAISHPTLVLDDATLASVLLRVVFEGVGAGIAGWRLHLQGAKSLTKLRRLKQQRQSTTSLFLDLHYDWMSVIGTTILPDVLEYDHEEAAFQQQPGTGAFMNSHYFQDTPNHQILTFIKNTTKLEAQLKAEQSNEALRRLVPAISEGLSDLKNWIIPEFDPPDQLRQNANEIWRQGALAHFYHVVCNSERSDRTVQDCVNAGIGAARNMPSRNGELRPLAWPLFMIGAEATDKEHRKFIKQAMIQTAEVTGLHSYMSLVMILSEVWKQYDLGDIVSSNWQTVMSRSGWELMLLF